MAVPWKTHGDANSGTVFEGGAHPAICAYVCLCSVLNKRMRTFSIVSQVVHTVQVLVESSEMESTLLFVYCECIMPWEIGSPIISGKHNKQGPDLTDLWQ